VTFKQAQDFYQRHRRWVPIVFFLLGFVFDAFLLRRIDELKTILQQALYLLLAATLIGAELLETTREIHPPWGLRKAWKYREAVLHFLLGTLLNSYTIFYFKSASALTSFVFIALLAGLLMLNEFKRFGKSQNRVHMALLSLCLVSYLVSLAPTVLGFIGLIPFLCAIAASALVSAGYYRLLAGRVAGSPGLARSQVLVPFVAIQAIFVLLYFANAIPPVPLSVSYMGIYHDVRKVEGGYQLSSSPNARFWQHGDQTFLARPGDSIFCFVQIFSPTHFKDQLQVRWLRHDEKLGWRSADVIPMPITGGRDEGFRAVTQKGNYEPGSWRVQIETADRREIGWIGFTVARDDSTGERALATAVR
jgi:hypothetical protein